MVGMQDCWYSVEPAGAVGRDRFFKDEMKNDCQRRFGDPGITKVSKLAFPTD